MAANFLNFNATDASMDQTSTTVFEEGALSIDFAVDVTSGDLVAVEVYAQNGTDVHKLGEFFSVTQSDGLVSLDGFTDLDGTQEIYGVAITSDGLAATSDPVDIDVLTTTTEFGTFHGNDIGYTQTSDSAYVLSALGGTDTLSLNFTQSSVASLNGASVASYDRDAFATTQAIYKGSAYDFLRTTDGRELYFQGVERLEFSDGSVLSMQTQPNDPEFVNQWDIHTGDVADAWRFTRGSDEVLLVSLDTGVGNVNGSVVTSDIDQGRTDYILPDNISNSDGDHGHRATSVMVAEANNNHGLTGLNWNSPTLVIDVYPETHSSISGALITNSIEETMDYIENSTARRVVFQGGIQGEYWLSRLNNSLLTQYEDSTLYAVAAGNGSLDMNDTTTNPVLSAGVARLAGTYDNIMAIGALSPVFQRVDGMQNVSQIPLAGYSNYGDDLTFAAPSTTRSIGPTGIVQNFGGTSNANPVVAGYSSLVWSVNPDMTAVEVRDIMTSTAMDLGDEGRDSTYGFGTPDAGRAVRRAWALSEYSELASLGVNSFSADSDLGYILTSNSSVDEGVDTSAGPFEVGTLYTSNSGATSLQYSLVSGDGDTDNASFSIDGDSLQIAQGTVVDFETQPTYSIRVEVSDGNVSQSQELTISVLDQADLTLTIGDGEAQRSSIDQLVIEFGGIVSLGSTPFELVKRGPDGGAVDVTATVDDSSGVSVVTLTFDGSFTEASGSLVDGNFQLTVFGDQIQTETGEDFDGDRDGIPGGNLVFGDTAEDNFFRRFGDSNADKIVDIFDLLDFRGAWLTETEDPDFKREFDSNGDGIIDVVDLLQLRRNWLERLEFV